MHRLAQEKWEILKADPSVSKVQKLPYVLEEGTSNSQDNNGVKLANQDLPKYSARFGEKRIQLKGARKPANTPQTITP